MLSKPCLLQQQTGLIAVFMYKFVKQTVQIIVAYRHINDIFVTNLCKLYFAEKDNFIYTYM